MKKLSTILVILMTPVVIISCSDVERTRGRDYMPDMRDSRAYETYAEHEDLHAVGINYNALPVPGTIKRGEVFPFQIPQDKEGDSVNYVASRQVANPLQALDTVQFKEAERLYLINCGICHGVSLDGNGPLYNGGNGPYPAAPKNLVGDPVVSVMPEGQMFYSVTYGKGAMGPYGPQLSTSQRWRIVRYLKMKQDIAKGGGNPAAAAGASDSAAGGSTQSGNAINGGGTTNPPGKGNVDTDSRGGTNLNASPAPGGVKK